MLKETLDSIRNTHLLALGICLALFLLGITPREAQRYENAARALQSLPDLPARTDTTYWHAVAQNVNDLKNLKLKGALAFEDSTSPLVTGKVEDPHGSLENILAIAPGWSSLKAPETKKVGDIASFIDEISWAIEPPFKGKSAVKKLEVILAKIPHFTIHGANVIRYPRHIEHVQIEITGEEGSNQRTLVLDSVEVNSQGEAPIFNILRLLYHGERASEPDPTTEKPWRFYTFTDSMTNDLTPVLQDVRLLTRDEAIREAAARLEKSRQTIAIFGFNIDERLATLVGPLLLMTVLLFLLTLAYQCNRLAPTGEVSLFAYPWPPFFEGRIGFFASFMLTTIAPNVAIFPFCARVWASSVSNGPFGAITCTVLSVIAIAIGNAIHHTITRSKSAVRAYRDQSSVSIQDSVPPPTTNISL